MNIFIRNVPDKEIKRIDRMALKRNVTRSLIIREFITRGIQASTKKPVKQIDGGL